MKQLIDKFTVEVVCEVYTDTETGEVTTEVASRKMSKATNRSKPKRKNDDNTKPILTLEDKKYSLNNAAIDLLGVEPDDKIDIKYEKRGNEIIPVIGNDEDFGTKGGCRLTKTGTVACRGARHDELVKFGTVFTLVPHESKPNLYILVNEDKSIEEALETPNEEIELPDDIDLSDLLEDGDAIEVTSDMFSL